MSPTSYQTAPPRVNETLTLLVAGYFVNNPANFFTLIDTRSSDGYGLSPHRCVQFSLKIETRFDNTMPELPEVECVVRQLRRLITGKKIVHARLIRPGLAPENPPRQFASSISNSSVESVGRRGKHILINLSNQRTLITHLRMTGRFSYLDEFADDPAHTHAILIFDDGNRLVFDDQRHFGMMMVVRSKNLNEVKCLADLGPEPFSEEFTVEYLHRTLGRSSRQIKLVLLDQTRVVGLGNIYASEALHRSGINPKTPANKISKRRIGPLHREIVAVLKEAIANDAQFDSESGDLDTSYGRYETVSKVYDREGMPCLNCGTQIRRITQGARSTYYCPRCQAR